jgi:SAM-dependent methyltransferase
MWVATDWRLKALVQQTCSWLPWGERLNYLLQRHLTRSLRLDDHELRMIVEHARSHIAMVRAHHPRPLETLSFFEFGAGWHLAGPLVFHALGVERQLLVDIRPLSRPALVSEAVDRLRGLDAQGWMRRRPPRFSRSAGLRALYGIDYRAPCDARRTGLAAESIDCVTSTDTLEHIPSDDVLAILRECHRILKPDGVASLLIDHQDHYSYFDRRITGINFLRYSDWAWAAYNSSLHHQNRLRHRDYLALVGRAGFTVVDERRAEPTRDELAALARVPLHPRFRGYTLQELAVKHSLLVLRKNA